MGCGSSQEDKKANAGLPDIKGKVVRRADKDYNLHRYQYGYSTFGGDGSMSPAAIIYPQMGKDPKQDVSAVLRYASDNKLRVAVRTGGHSYTGVSSTFGDNVTLDLSEAFKEFEWDEKTGLLRTGVSFHLGEFNYRMTQYGLFVPHGQCTWVHLGGHASTGGYGQLARGFGLLCDHIKGVECVTPDGKEHVLNRDRLESQEDKDLFWALIGGSPGNIAVVTHVTLKPLQDKDHPHTIGFKGVAVYDKEVLRRVMQLTADLNADDDLSGNFDFMVSILSTSQTVLPEIGMEEFPDQFMAHKHEAFYGKNEMPFWPAGMIVFAQWNNLGGPEEKPDDAVYAWFENIKAIMTNPATGLPPIIFPTVDPVSKHQSAVKFIDGKNNIPMSRLAANWVFTNTREFQLPHNKRGYWSNKQDLNTNGWVDWITNRIDEAQSNPWNGLKITCQIHPYGGKHSRFVTQRSDDVAMSWRADSTMSATMDVFYDDASIRHAMHEAANDAEEALAWFTEKLTGKRIDVIPPTKLPEVAAAEWQAENDKSIGATGVFCDHHRRVLWGAFGDKDMTKVWNMYYDSQDKYDRLCKVKKAVDPNSVLSPNEFVAGGSGVKFAADGKKDDAPAEDDKDTCDAKLGCEYVKLKQAKA